MTLFGDLRLLDLLLDSCEELLCRIVEGERRLVVSMAHGNLSMLSMAFCLSRGGLSLPGTLKELIKKNKYLELTFQIKCEDANYLTWIVPERNVWANICPTYRPVPTSENYRPQ